MDASACRVCGEPTSLRASFCSQCGAPLEDPLPELLLGDRSRRGSGFQRGNRRRAVAVPLAVLAALVAVFALLPRGGTEQGTPRAGTEAVDQPSSAPTSVARAFEKDGSVSVSAAAQADPPDRREPGASVDPGILPQTVASHLAFRVRNELQFLDLETGVWTSAELRSDVYRSYPVGPGLVLVLPSGGVAYASVQGGPTTRIADPTDGSFLGVKGDLVVLSVGGSRGAIETRRVDATVASEIELPVGAWTQGMTAQGDVVIQANEWIALIDPVSGTHVPLATGTFAGLVGDLVLVGHCNAELECRIDQIDTRTGGRAEVTDDAGWFGPAAGQSIPFTAMTGESSVFHVVDGVLTREADVPDAPDPAESSATDARDPAESSATDAPTGVTVESSGQAILFVDPAGHAIVELDLPFGFDAGSTPSLALIGSRS